MMRYPRRLLPLLCGAFIVLTGLGSLAPAAAQDDDAAALLRESATAMGQLTSFGFELSTVQGRSTIYGGLELKEVSGAVERPESFRAEATVSLAFASVTLKVIGIGPRVWVTDPRLPGESYTEIITGGEESARLIDTMLNPDALLLRAIEFIQEPEIEGEEKIRGEDATLVTGTFDPREVLEAGGIATPENDDISEFLVLEPMPIWIWIDQSNRVVRMELVGPITTSESEDVVRRLELFDFDQPANIEPPV
jgi:hypothetical protein